MTRKLEEILTATAESVFEGLTFLFALAPEEAVANHSPMVTAGVRYEGECNGMVAVAVSENLLASIAANMLGEENINTLTQEQCQDALKELANVLGGPIVAALAGSRHVPRLLPPHYFNHAAPPGVPTAETKMFFDNGQAHVMLFMDEGCR